MTRVLLVYHDIDVADIESDELRRAGFEVDRCAGPVGGSPCPVVHGQPCWQVADADVLVYDVWEGGHGGKDLVEDIRALHPDKPLVLTSSGPPGTGEPDAVAPTRATLVAAVKRALRTHVTPETATRDHLQSRQAPAYQGPRW